MYTPHTVCRACGNGKAQIPTLKQSCAAGPGSEQNGLVSVFDLGIQPLANDFCDATQERAGYAPLNVMYCPNCTLAQLSVVVKPEILYRRYSYVTSPSETMQNHFQTLAQDIESETSGRSLLEIGSNDGRLLQFFTDRGYKDVIGIDPAENLCNLAKSKGLKVVNSFFSKSCAEDLAQWFLPDIILARHVFCHCPDWNDFIEGLKLLSGPDTLICIEVPYVGDLLARGEFDTIYHEHLSLLSIKSIRVALENTGLKLVRVIRYPIHGGAILLMIRPICKSPEQHISVLEFLNSEDQTMTIGAWRDFAEKALDNITALKLMVENLVSEGKRVAALGASAKSTVWIASCGFTRKDVAFIADTTPQKLWKQSPGAGIPIVDEGAILRELPDYVLVFAWNFREEILKKNELARSKGVKFIFPVPMLEVL